MLLKGTINVANRDVRDVVALWEREISEEEGN
jgi:hypothetical protein